MKENMHLGLVIKLKEINIYVKKLKLKKKKNLQLKNPY